jgi:hypothetical protein
MIKGGSLRSGRWCVRRIDVICRCREFKQYIKGRPEMRADDIRLNFSQTFARKLVLQSKQHHEQHDPSAAAGEASAGDHSKSEAMLEQMLKEGGEINFGGGGAPPPHWGTTSGGGTSGSGPAATSGGTKSVEEMTQMEKDELLARQLQEDEIQFHRGGLRRMGMGDEYSTDSGSEYDSDEELVGEVAAGGWRMREQQQQEGVAQDEDVTCLEVRKLGGDGKDIEGHCPVCQEPWKEGDEQRVLPCGHEFHPSW